MKSAAVRIAPLALCALVWVIAACEPCVYIDKPLPDSDVERGAIVHRAVPADWIADWTLLIYAANDDLDPNLVAAFDEDALEWQHGLGGSALFRILVQRDYAPFQLSADGLPRPTERYAIYREERHHPDYPPGSGGPEAMFLGETDTTSATTLRDFLVDGIRRFPARHYWVTFTGHGDGFAGLAHDASAAPGKRLSIAGLAAALSEAAAVIASEIRTKYDYGGPNTSNRIDVVSFDACRLGMVEVAASIANTADFMIASRESMPQAGHPYSALRYIAQDEPRANPRSLVEAVVTDYVRAYVEGVSTAGRAYVGTSITSVGLDLRNVGELEKRLANLADVIEKTRPGGFSCAEVRSLTAEVCQENHIHLDDSNQRTTPTAAAAASIDLVALLEHLAHHSSCIGSTTTNKSAAGEIARAANRALELIGRPAASNDIEYEGQYRKMVGFGPSSPFVIEAQRVDSGQNLHLGGLGVFWGNPYDLLYRENGHSLFDTYQSLPFEKNTGWTRMLATCIEEAQACRSYQPSPDEPFTSGPCANF